MPQSILQFWFHEIAPAQWWKVDPAFDGLIADRFGEIHSQALRGELFEWRADPKGRLAEVIVLDQFSQSIFRGSHRAFEADALALVLAQEAVSLKADAALPVEERSFLYMPYMHSESRRIHEVAERFFREGTSESSYNFELRHKAIIDRFGRYPHRNFVLGRESTREEIAFLTEPGSKF